MVIRCPRPGRRGQLKYGDKENRPLSGVRSCKGYPPPLWSRNAAGPRKQGSVFRYAEHSYAALFGKRGYLGLELFPIALDHRCREATAHTRQQCVLQFFKTRYCPALRQQVALLD